jgi:hypothetical protein
MAVSHHADNPGKQYDACGRDRDGAVSRPFFDPRLIVFMHGSNDLNQVMWELRAMARSPNPGCPK